MIEDSLKTTRNLHRFIVTVSAASIVFSMSLSVSDEKYSQLLDLRVLQSLDFREYEDFTDKAIREFSQESLKPVGLQIASELDVNLVGSSNVAEIARVFETQIWNRRLHLPRNWSEEPTLDDCLDIALRLGVPDITEDVRVWIPPTEGISSRIEEILAENDFGPKDSIYSINPSGNRSYGSSAPPREIQFYLDVGPMKYSGERVVLKIPSRSGTFETIPNTSFLYWLQLHEGAERLIKAGGDGTSWLSNLAELPEALRSENLIDLIDQFQQDIDRGGPRQRAVSLLGVEVPGILFVYSGPLLLLVFSFYLLNHVRHLKSLVRGGVEAFREFAWMPLALDKHWGLEVLGTCLFLPVGSVFVLFYKLYQTHNMTWTAGIILLGLGFGLVWLGLRVYRQIRALRDVLHESSN